ncbi:ABC transporter permease [Pararhizobium sp. PWRC1-1]|uniref:ABC transporter permease n=1 Tax=Pararhizobium sp. PWRC1-1 TaxID=2804566 RepID=UPI003CF75A86
MLRDMRTRFGRSHFGYIMAILWPFSHLVIMASSMAYARRFVPTGGDPIVNAVTGILPYILCLYPARMMGQAIELNRALLFFPVVRAIDIMISRALIEMFTASIVVILLFFLAFLLDVDLIPVNIYAFVSGIIATIFLAISIGFFSNIAKSVFKMWQIVFILSVIVMYLTSGVVWNISLMPREMQVIVSYNPLFQSVEWLRSAYYEDSYSEFLSETYLIMVSAVIFLLGLLGERFLRGKLLSS